MSFRRLLDTHEILVAPGAYDALSAKVVAQAGFPLVYVTGLGNEASDLGCPDLGLTTATELVRRAGTICQAVEVPVVCDADTGFGGPANVARTVRLFEAAGVSAIHLEDQTFPKRCGVLAGKQVVPARGFARALRGAADARRGREFALIARTDAKGAEGVEGVVDRLRLYAENGADLVMLGDFYSREEYERIVAEVPAPVVACAADPDHFDRQPDFTVDQWRAMGVKMVVYWYLPLFAALHAVREAVGHLGREGSIEGLRPRLATYRDYAATVELDRWLGLGEPDGPEGR
ncbi:MAG: isocitrate lyase/PEP mutase family protein [Deferrisomatales bacterium]